MKRTGHEIYYVTLDNLLDKLRQWEKVAVECGIYVLKTCSRWVFFYKGATLMSEKFYEIFFKTKREL